MHHVHPASLSTGKKTAHPALITAVFPFSFMHVAWNYPSRDVIIVAPWSTFLNGVTPYINTEFLYTWFSAITTHSRHLVWSMTLKAQALNSSKGNGTHISLSRLFGTIETQTMKRNKPKQSSPNPFISKNSICRWGLKKTILVIHSW